MEAWLGRPDHNGKSPRKSYVCDFWRASLDGKLYTIHGYLEDGQDSPGSVIYTSSPVVRIGEGLLFASRFAEEFDGVDQIAMHCRFTGLEGRCLGTAGYRPPFLLGGHFLSSTDEDILSGQITQRQVQDNLAEVLHPLLERLYEKFNFFTLPFDLVANELQKLRSNRY